MRILLFLVFATTCVFPQPLIERTYLMRTGTTTVDPYSGMTHLCVLVYMDGKYRLERSFQGLDGGKPEVKVYLDQLPNASLKQLQATIDDASFLSIRTPEPREGIIPNMDTLTITVPREHALQSIIFQTAKERKPFEKSLKPLLS